MHSDTEEAPLNMTQYVVLAGFVSAVALQGGQPSPPADCATTLASEPRGWQTQADTGRFYIFPQYSREELFPPTVGCAAELVSKPLGWQTQAGFVFSHSTPGRELPSTVNCTLGPDTEP